MCQCFKFRSGKTCFIKIVSERHIISEPNYNEINKQKLTKMLANVKKLY